MTLAVTIALNYNTHTKILQVYNIRRIVTRPFSVSYARAARSRTRGCVSTPFAPASFYNYKLVQSYSCVFPGNTAGLFTQISVLAVRA